MSRPLAADSPLPVRAPLHWVWSQSQNDSAYTIDPERRRRLIREQGYVDMGIVAWVGTVAAPRVRPLVCLYASAPRTDTFCSISTLEQRLVRALGYTDASVEGFVQTEPVPGSVALFRLSRGHGPGDRDREHRFTISDAELVRLRKEGWTYDGTKGFVFPGP